MGLSLSSVWKSVFKPVEKAFQNVRDNIVPIALGGVVGGAGIATGGMQAGSGGGAPAAATGNVPTTRVATDRAVAGSGTGPASGQDRTWLYVAGGVGALVLILVLVLAFSRRS